jgi:hypothetical protein
MRKLTLGVGAICLCFALVLPATADPGISTYSNVTQIAWADWLDMNGATGTFYGAFAFRYADAHGVFIHTLGIAIKGECRREKGVMVDRKERRIPVWFIVCWGRGVGGDLAHQDFRMDPLLSSASLRMDKGQYVHQVSWTGRGDGPDEDHSVMVRGTRVSAEVDMDRGAKPEGKLFGQRMKSGWNELGFLNQSVNAMAKLSAQGVDVDFLRDGTVKVTRRYVMER